MGDPDTGRGIPEQEQDHTRTEERETHLMDMDPAVQRALAIMEEAEQEHAAPQDVSTDDAEFNPLLDTYADLLRKRDRASDADRAGIENQILSVAIQLHQLQQERDKLAKKIDLLLQTATEKGNKYTSRNATEQIEQSSAQTKEGCARIYFTETLKIGWELDSIWKKIESMPKTSGREILVTIYLAIRHDRQRLLDQYIPYGDSSNWEKVPFETWREFASAAEQLHNRIQPLQQLIEQYSHGKS